MEQGRYVKIRKSQRLQKTEQRKIKENHQTPQKYFDMNSKFNKTTYFLNKMEYNYDCPDSKTWKWMKEQFEGKLDKYLGNKEYVQRKSRL